MDKWQELKKIIKLDIQLCKKEEEDYLALLGKKQQAEYHRGCWGADEFILAEMDRIENQEKAELGGTPDPGQMKEEKDEI